jgi:hypothetical protein
MEEKKSKNKIEQVGRSTSGLDGMKEDDEG